MNTRQKTDLPSLLKKFFSSIARSPFLQQGRFITFLFFVILSATFWFVRAMGEPYETIVEYPVRYTNFPEDKVLIGRVPDKLHLKVRARGFNILKSKLNLNIIPLRFNVNSFSLNSLGTDTFYLITETVKDVLSTELDNTTILDISPDTLFFRFSAMAIKKVPVMPLLAMHDKFFQQQYMQNGIIHIKPDSIIVSGPGSIVNSIENVFTESLSFTNLSDTTKIECGLKPIDMVTFSQLKVKVSIPVDRFTEVEERLSVIPFNVPDSLNMIAIPGQVTVTYRICLSNYNRVKNTPLTPRIDYAVMQENNIQRLTVFLTDTPGYVSNIRFDPKVIEFLITRK